MTGCAGFCSESGILVQKRGCQIDMCTQIAHIFVCSNGMKPSGLRLIEERGSRFPGCGTDIRRPVRSFMPHHAAITRTALSRSLKSAASCTPLYGSGRAGKISGLFRSGGQEMAKNGPYRQVHGLRSWPSSEGAARPVSDWARAASMTSEEIEAQVAARSRRGGHGGELG